LGSEDVKLWEVDCPVVMLQRKQVERSFYCNFTGITKHALEENSDVTLEREGERTEKEQVERECHGRTEGQ
jgi:hypothetical protein